VEIAWRSDGVCEAAVSGSAANSECCPNVRVEEEPNPYGYGIVGAGSLYAKNQRGPQTHHHRKERETYVPFKTFNIIEISGRE
jgi:hypothetical protein